MFNSPRTVFCDVYYLTPECKTPAGCRYQFTLFFSTPQLLLAIAAPSRRAPLEISQYSDPKHCGCCQPRQRPRRAHGTVSIITFAEIVGRPDPVPAMKFSWPAEWQR